MRIAVIGAAGEPGRRIVAEAEKKGISVTSVVSDPSVMPGNGPVIIKDFRELEGQDLEGMHAVVDAESFPRICRYSSDELPLWRIGGLLKGTGAGVLAVGLTSCLYADSSRTAMVTDGCCMTQDGREQALRLCATASRRLRSERSFNWTMLCPPLILDEDAPATGSFVFGDDVLPMGLDGSSRISGPDFARACVELLLRGLKPFSIVSARSA
jgi:putative NADH-flavin reductase